MAEAEGPGDGDFRLTHNRMNHDGGRGPERNRSPVIYGVCVHDPGGTAVPGNADCLSPGADGFSQGGLQSHLACSRQIRRISNAVARGFPFLIIDVIGQIWYYN